MAQVTRRTFLTNISLGITAMGLCKFAVAKDNSAGIGAPLVISTWKHGLKANETAWDILSEGGYALDAVEAGVRATESDPGVTTAGYGGFPDALGKVTLDACVMNEKGDAGSVAFLQNIEHPVSVARLVMERTPHAMLCGDGALKFALENGFEKEKLLTKEMRKRWKIWKKEEQELNAKTTKINRLEDHHDTISMLAIDENGRLSGACTTSGLAYKMHGRVGDSPIIGAGLFVDGEIGGAAATGAGELVMKTMGSFLVVEFMRNGMSPEEACNAAISRIVMKIPESITQQVGYIAIDKSGEVGAASLQTGFNYALKARNITGLREAGSWFKKL